MSKRFGSHTTHKVHIFFVPDYCSYRFGESNLLLPLYNNWNINENYKTISNMNIIIRYILIYRTYKEYIIWKSSHLHQGKMSTIKSSQYFEVDRFIIWNLVFNLLWLLRSFLSCTTTCIVNRWSNRGLQNHIERMQMKFSWDFTRSTNTILNRKRKWITNKPIHN